HPAASCDWRCTGNFHLGRSLAYTIAKREVNGFFNSESAGAEPAVLQPLRHESIRIFVFLPDANIGAISLWAVGNLFACAAFLEGGAHIKRCPFSRENHSKEAFSAPPTDACVIGERRAFHQEDGIEFAGRHQFAGL